jgi:hypothetical protein
MIRFYFHPTPNPAKVSLFLEEAGLPYETVPVDTRKGEQHLPAFRYVRLVLSCGRKPPDETMTRTRIGDPGFGNENTRLPCPALQHQTGRAHCDV